MGRRRDDRRRQQRRSALKIHIAVYVAVQLLVFATWLVTTPEVRSRSSGGGPGLVAHAGTPYTSPEQSRTALG